MQPLLHLVASLAPAAAGALLASVWEGLLLAACVALCLRLFPRLSAAARSLVWVAVLAVVLLLPVFSLGFAHASSTVHGHSDALRVSERWSFALAALWAALSAFRLVQLAVSAVRLRGLAGRATPVEVAPALAALLQSGSRTAELCVSGEVGRPSVAGFFCPRVLLPPELLEKLTPAELGPIVLHEMEHLRRRDDWTNLLQKLGLALLPLNPVLLWLDRRLCLERELACDDGVLRATQARKAYAACLANLAEASLVRRGVLLALGLMGKRPSELARRVYRILQGPKAAMKPMQTRLATCALLTFIAGGAAVLAHSPTLVSFVPANNTVVAASTAPRVSGSVAALAAIPARATNSLPVAHPHAVLTRVAMSVAPRTALRVGEKKACRRAPPLKRVAQNEHKAGPWSLLTGWQGEAVPVRVVQLVTQQQLGHAQFPDSQLTYALPTRDGWLIVQL